MKFTSAVFVLPSVLAATTEVNADATRVLKGKKYGRTPNGDIESTGKSTGKNGNGTSTGKSSKGGKNGDSPESVCSTACYNIHKPPNGYADGFVFPDDCRWNGQLEEDGRCPAEVEEEQAQACQCWAETEAGCIFGTDKCLELVSLVVNFLGEEFEVLEDSAECLLEREAFTDCLCHGCREPDLR